MKHCAFLLLFVLNLVVSPGLAQPKPGQVLVVQNALSADSKTIAAYYLKKRKLPAQNLFTVKVPDREGIAYTDYLKLIQEPIKAYIQSKKLTIDFIVLTRGFPYHLGGGPRNDFSLDSVLGMMDYSLLETRTQNPYFARASHFTHKKYGNYLVSRFDGYTLKDCLALIDRAVIAKPVRGPFLMVPDQGRNDGGYKGWNDAVIHAHGVLVRKHFDTQLGNGLVFKTSPEPLMGYASWGSNDHHFKPELYRSLKFLPGSIAETAVSSSGRTFRDPKQPGQSLIADLIAQGVTGCKGYVSEPYVDAIGRPDTIFDAYTEGLSLVEALYSGSFWVNWKDVMIGDPLCAPYAVKR